MCLSGTCGDKTCTYRGQSRGGNVEVIKWANVLADHEPLAKNKSVVESRPLTEVGRAT